MKFVKLNIYYDKEIAKVENLGMHEIGYVLEVYINVNDISVIWDNSDDEEVHFRYTNGRVRIAKDFKKKEDLIKYFQTQLHEHNFTDKLNKIVGE